MNFQDLPVDQILEEISTQVDPAIAFGNIVDLGREALPSQIWNTFNQSNLLKDIEDATIWLQDVIDAYPKTTGIYLGLDTLNMDGGKGKNVEIGLSYQCDPNIFSDEWIFDCKNYESFLIEGLYQFSDSFHNELLWLDDERSFSEYIIFLGYSGLILREALIKMKTDNDFLSIWGFHDGDMFFLVNKIGHKRDVIANMEM